MITKVTNQTELDAALKSDDWDIIIDSPRGVWLLISNSNDKSVRAYGSATVRAYGSATVSASGSATVSASGSATVRAYDSATVSAYDSATVSASDSATVSASDSATVRAYDSATVSASDSATVRAYDSATVSASDSATVSASGSATVSAYDSATVRAYGSATVSAYDSATVSAYGSATVRAYDSATVRAYDSATVRAYDSATVRAGSFVAIHLHSKRVTHNGGVIIDVTDVKLDKLEQWAAYHGTEIIDGEVIVYKAVDDNLESARRFAYPIGETVVCPDWRQDGQCGNGLHLSPSPTHAQRYFESATRFLKCAVPLAELSLIDPTDVNTPPKLKAKTVRVIVEVDVHGREIKAVAK